MIAKTKVCLFVAVFAIFLAAYLLLPTFTETSGIAGALEIFDDPHVNFAFLIFLFLLTSLLFTLFFHFFCCVVRGNETDRFPIGDILISEGFISSEDLQVALKEQALRMGEFLVGAKRITPEQRDHAMAIQKKTKGRIGEILIQLGYASQADIDWALKKTGRRLGEILIDKKIISEYDLTCAMSFNKCIKDADGKIIVIK
jgi:hypothetical protein